MRIAFITPEFVTEPYYSGGLANYLSRLAHTLVSAGHDVHIVVESNQPGGVVDFHGVTVHQIRTRHFPRILRRLTRYSVRDAPAWLTFSFSAWRKINQLSKTKPFDLVQVANYRACGLFTVAFSNIPIITRVSSIQKIWNLAHQVDRKPGVRLEEALERIQLHLSRDIVCPSKLLATFMSNKANTGQRIRIIRSPAFVETDRFDFSVYDSFLAGKQYLLYFGRLELLKGAHILTWALPRILKSLPDCSMVFVGRDCASVMARSMRDWIRVECKEYVHRVIFLDAIPHTQLYPIIENARLVVLPSLVDNLPNAMLESMMLAKPVVGTIGASFDELIEDEKSGFLVTPGDPGALAVKVIEAWNHPDLEAIGKRGNIAVSACAPDRILTETLAYYEEVAKR